MTRQRVCVWMCVVWLLSAGCQRGTDVRAELGESAQARGHEQPSQGRRLSLVRYVAIEPGRFMMGSPPNEQDHASDEEQALVTTSYLSARD
jgi:formylglycine-generating enzyme required for sulfatase activity